MIEKQSGSKLPGNPQVFIYGPLKLQNELIAWFLQQTSGLSCADLNNSELEKLLNQRHGHDCLIMLDCQGSSPAGLWARIRDISEADSEHFMTALFNVASGHKIQNDLVSRGVRGVFFNDDPLTNLSKGVSAILNGELWLSRELLVKCLFESRDTSDEPDLIKYAAGTLGTFLTLREKEILVMIASGVSNRKIASFLGISTNTVKTHIYNIYSKINVPNRLQAALWAAKYL
jgi:LuxR family transcriptional regulator, positive regulator of biofilm formation